MSFRVFNDYFSVRKKFPKSELGRKEGNMSEGGRGYGSKMKVLLLLCSESLKRMTTDTLSNEKSFKKGTKLLWKGL
jgi:membrane glycosyltransferase